MGSTMDGRRHETRAAMATEGRLIPRHPEIHLIATSERKPAHRASSWTTWIRPAVLFCGWALVIAALVLAGQIFANDQVRARGVAQTPKSTPVTTRSAPKPLVDDDLAHALAVKPLTETDRSDRVIYQGRVCRWLSRGKDINTSVIKCPGDAVGAKVATVQLTPVEKKTN